MLYCRHRGKYLHLLAFFPSEVQISYSIPRTLCSHDAEDFPFSSFPYLMQKGFSDEVKVWYDAVGGDALGLTLGKASSKVCFLVVLK